MKLKYHNKNGEAKKYPQTIFEDRDFLQEKINLLEEENKNLRELLGNSIKSSKGINTGMKDKNGKEIHEGDVLQYPDSTIREVVKWVENMWTEEGFMTGFGEFTFTPDQYEIIGNIYENPKLAK